MVLPDKTREAIDKLQGKEYPQYYCQRCGELLQRRGKIKIMSYDLASGEPICRVKLKCPKRTRFSHRTCVCLERNGNNGSWNMIISDWLGY